MKVSTARRKLLAILAASACTSALALTGVATATPALAEGPVNGCPYGDGCLYNSQAAFNAGTPTDALAQPRATEIIFVLEGTLDVGFVNNTGDVFWTSEGNFVLFAQFDGLLDVCVYEPDSHDVQAPDTTEDPADSASVDGVAFGETQASVSGTVIVALNLCA